MSKYIVLTAVLLLGCSPPIPLATCPILETVEGFQPVIEGTEVLSILGGPSTICGRTATADVELTAPDGTIVPVNSMDLVEVFRPAEGPPLTLRAASIRFTASQPGVWKLVAKWSTSGETQRNVLVIKTIGAGPSVLRRYVDRMDNCERGPFRTNAGAMLCQRNAEVWVYGPDGQIQDHFPGFQLAVRGDEVWSSAAGALEHRTSLPGALRLDGAVPLAQVGPEGPTVPGKAVRGDSQRVIEASWDGTTLSSTTIAEGYPIFDEVILTQGTETWTPARCQIQRGCSIAECEPVRICPGGNLVPVMAIDPDRVWSTPRHTAIGDVSVATIHVHQRPLDHGRGPSTILDLLFENGFVMGMFNRHVAVERVHFVASGFVVLPYQPTPGTIDFVAIPDPGVATTVTDEWVVSRGGDPFTLLSTAVPSIP